MNSIMPLMGFVTKQWWAYDAERDCFINPPIEILNEMDKILGGLQEAALQNMIDQNPAWLFDEKRYYYGNINI